MNVVEQKKLTAKWNSDIARRFEVSRRINYYENNQKSYLEKALKKAYPNSAKDMVNKFEYLYPLTKRIFDDISILFAEPVVVSQKNDTLKETFEDIIEGAKFNPIMNKTNLLVNLTDKVGVIPVWRNEKVELDIITADNCFVVQEDDDPTQIKELFYQVGVLTDSPGKLDTIKTYTRWTKETQSIVDVDNSSGNIKNERDDVENKFGKIPVVWFENDIPVNTFWYEKRNHIVDTNEIVNLELTNFRYILAFQAFSTLVEIGNSDTSDKPFGASFSLRLPFDPANPQSKPDAKYITPDPKLAEIWKVIMEIIIGSAQSVGVSAEAYRRENSTVNSGYQLKLSKSDILKKTKADRPFYRASIKELVENMTTLYTQNNESKTFDKIEVKVDFGEVVFEENPKEKEDVRAMKLANGTANEIDFIIEDNPDLDRAEAIKFYNDRQDERKQYKIGVGIEDAISGKKTE